MTNVIVYSLGYEHDNDVKNSFIKGYASNGARYTGSIDILQFVSLSSCLEYANNENYEFVIYSATNGESLSGVANYYYPKVVTFFPAGSNTHGQVFYQSITSNKISSIICGTTTGNNQNVTGYNVEFIDNDPISQNKLSSYSTGFIAGKIAYIKDWLKCTNWQARNIARQTASLKDNFTNINGFGVINIHDALNSYVNIPDDPLVNLGNIGTISVNRNESTISINIDAVTNANAYKIYRNDVLIYNGSNTNFSDIVSPIGIFNYKYKAYNNKTETEFSNTTQIVYRAYQKIYYK